MGDEGRLVRPTRGGTYGQHHDQPPGASRHAFQCASRAPSAVPWNPRERWILTAVSERPVGWDTGVGDSHALACRRRCSRNRRVYCCAAQGRSAVDYGSLTSSTTAASAGAAACQKAALQDLPPDAPPEQLLGPLRAWWGRQSITGSGIGFENQTAGNAATPTIVGLNLPSGCHQVADALRARYGAHIRVEENFAVTPA